MQSPDLFPTMWSWSGKTWKRLADNFDERAYNITPCYSVFSEFDIDTAWRCNPDKQVSWEFFETGEGLKITGSTWPLLEFGPQKRPTTPTASCVWSFFLYASFCCGGGCLSTWATEKTKAFLGRGWLITLWWTNIVYCFEMHQEWRFVANLSYIFTNIYICIMEWFTAIAMSVFRQILYFSQIQISTLEASFARQKRQNRLRRRTVRTAVHLATCLCGCGRSPFK